MSLFSALQKHLGLDIDQLKAKLLSEEGILRSKFPERQNPGKRPFNPHKKTIDYSQL